MVEISILGKCREVSSSSKISEQTVHYHCTFLLSGAVQRNHLPAVMETIATYPKSNSTLTKMKAPSFDLTHYSVSVTTDDAHSSGGPSEDGDAAGEAIDASASVANNVNTDEVSDSEQDVVTVVHLTSTTAADAEDLSSASPSLPNGFVEEKNDDDKLTLNDVEPLRTAEANEEIDVIGAKDADDRAKLSEQQSHLQGESAQMQHDAAQQSPSSPKITNIPILRLTRAKREDCSSWSRWLFGEITKIYERTPDHVAMIDEIGERRYISYHELIENVNRAANFLHHHGIEQGSHVAMCLNNSMDFVYMQIGLYLIGAVPVLLNPGRVGSGSFPRFNCNAVLVDNCHYAHVLRLFDHFVGAKQIFVFTNDLASLYIPHFVWIIDGSGYADFPADNHVTPAEQDSDWDVVAFSTSGTNSHKSKVVAHGSISAHRLCTQHLDVLMAHLFDMVAESRTHLLITSGLHTIDAWSLLIYSLISDQTVIITESNSEVWAVSLLDRIAELIRLYDVALITCNAQFLKSFVKYETEKLFDISSLKVVSYSGSPLPTSVAKKFHNATGASVVQSYSTTEYGLISCGLQNFDDTSSLSCGTTCEGISVKITDSDEDSELEKGEWGRILLQAPIRCSSYFGGNINDMFTKNKYMRTGDIGMLDEKNRLYVAGPADGLLKFNNQTIVSPLLENALLSHASVEDVVISLMNDELTAGVVLAEDAPPPTLYELNELISDLNMGKITKLVFVDFIPRSETGKLLRSEVLFLLQTEADGRVVGNCVV